MRKRHRRIGILAISPLFLLIALLCGVGLCWSDITKIPLVFIFLLASCYALSITRGLPLGERIQIFSKGAGSSGLLLMVWIFIWAGAFAESARSIGAVEATVNLALMCLPPEMLLAGMFVAACAVSLSIGTSVGTIVALVPMASGVAQQIGIDLPLMVAAVAGGAFFGDNLSFISDTTIAATRTQGCRLSDKFRVNVKIVLPAAILVFLLYIVLGKGAACDVAPQPVDLLKVTPYVVVLLLAILGMDVLLVLIIGNLLSGVIGMACGDFGLEGWVASMTAGISSMGELIIISMLAGGLLEVIKHNGGITYLIRLLTRRISGRRGAELSIAALACLANLCTANNTVAILSVGKIANDIAERFSVDKRKSASILDTFSCAVQGTIPYGAQLLMAGGLAAITPMEIIPYMYYPMLTAVVALLAIGLRYPRKYS